MRTRRVRGTALLVTALSLVLAAGCSTGGGTAAAQESDVHATLTVGVVPALDSAGFFIAYYQGLFKAQGLDVTIVPVFTSSQQTVTDIEKGRADISSGDYVTYVDDELVDNAHLEIVGEASILQPNQLALFVKDGSKIVNLSQLEGKQVSVAGHDDKIGRAHV